MGFKVKRNSFLWDQFLNEEYILNYLLCVLKLSSKYDSREELYGINEEIYLDGVCRMIGLSVPSNPYSASMN